MAVLIACCRCRYPAAIWWYNSHHANANDVSSLVVQRTEQHFGNVYAAAQGGGVIRPEEWTDHDARVISAVRPRSTRTSAIRRMERGHSDTIIDESPVNSRFDALRRQTLGHKVRRLRPFQIRNREAHRAERPQNKRACSNRSFRKVRLGSWQMSFSSCVDRRPNSGTLPSLRAPDQAAQFLDHVAQRYPQICRGIIRPLAPRPRSRTAPPCCPLGFLDHPLGFLDPNASRPKGFFDQYN
jgi:hypothetical protein